MANIIKWVPLSGKWSFDGPSAKYLGSSDPNFKVGIALSDVTLRSGHIKTQVSFDNPEDSAGRILFSYNASTRDYLSAGIGGYNFAYILDKFTLGKGWEGIRGQGSKENLEAGVFYDLKVEIRGQNIRIIADSVKVIEENLSGPLFGDQIGLFAWGPGGITFKNTNANPMKPKAFVVMQFGEPYDSLYSEVIKTVAEEIGLEAYRVDDIYKPGIILQDIIRGIREAEVVVAEITPVNANVFYELGYAHALGKQTILLAEKGHELPFDIRSYRCIFYDNTIRGKRDIESNLRKHLTNIMKNY